MKGLLRTSTLLTVLAVSIALALGEGTATAGPTAPPKIFLPAISKGPLSGPRPLYFLGPCGGTGGEAFQDAVPDDANPTGFAVRSGLAIDSIQMILNTGPLGNHGGDGGALTEITLESGEYITALSGKAGYFLDTGLYVVLLLTIHTNVRSYGPYGDKDAAGDNFSLAVPAGNEIVGFFGRSGAWMVDSIGAVYRMRY